MNRAGEDLDAGARGAGWAGFPAELCAAVDAGEELVEGDAGGSLGAWATADGEALASGERGVLGGVAVVLEVAGEVVGVVGGSLYPIDIDDGPSGDQSAKFVQASKPWNRRIGRKGEIGRMDSP